MGPAPTLRVTLVVEDAEDDDRVLHHTENDQVGKALQVDLLVWPTPLLKTIRMLPQEFEVLLHLIVKLLTQALALVLILKVPFDELRTGPVPDLQPEAHAFFALRAISRTSSHV